MQRQIISIVFLGVALALLSCSSDKNPTGSPEVTLTEEAQLAALWLSDEAFVPEDLAWDIQNKLTLLREKYAGEIPQVNIEFLFPAAPKMISITMESEALAEFKAGNYHEWDNLNQKYGMDSIFIQNEVYGWVDMKFKEHINPYVAASEYSRLSGIKYANAGEYGGDWPNNYPWIVDGEIAFLVREAWGDCPAGCIFSKFWYFKSSGDQINLIGNFEMDEDWWQNPIYPDWWEEIVPALNKYRHFWVEPE